MTQFRRFWPIPFFAILAVICSVVYCLVAQPLFEVTGSIGIMRPTLPPVSNFMPETQNRWVWIRDGLAMKNMLLQDSLLQQIIAQSEILRQRLHSYSLKLPKMAQEDTMSNYIAFLKKSIKVQYTGGDANIFIFTVTDSNPALAKEVVNILMDRLKALYDEVMFKRNDASLNALHLKTVALKQDLGNNRNGAMNSFLKGRISAAYDAEAKLYVESVLQTIQSQTLLKVINTPYIPAHPIWPRWDLLILFSTVTGLLVGVFFYYIISRIHE
ncbi:MAG: hypothetical protein A2X86_13885 [Bdellovibrionales bacterium GWA2_49_15]|nr:MAG: hypothetical protein A2X86_13885 [Bdellovibrionales bacterium GWA2_49_15]HAZ13619.1 hypothetical protein [Bdellovibrionales bacterium]